MNTREFLIGLFIPKTKMHFSMFFVIDCFKIFWMVICFTSIFVMDNFIRLKGTTIFFKNQICHFDISLFIRPSMIWPMQKPVTLCTQSWKSTFSRLLDFWQIVSCFATNRTKQCRCFSIWLYFKRKSAKLANYFHVFCSFSSLQCFRYFMNLFRSMLEPLSELADRITLSIFTHNYFIVYHGTL